MSRFDLFTNVHKAIRALLFETTIRVGRTAFADAAEAAATAASLRVLFVHLEEHAAQADAVLMPELQRLAPELFAELQDEHTRTAGMQAELAALLDRLDGATADERLALGQRLHHRLHRLVAAHLAHLEREEVEAHRVLWAHCTDAELQTLHARIIARNAPARVAHWLALILPAIARPERARLLRELQHSMPAAVFASVTAPARAALGEGAWTEALAAVAA